MIEGKLEKKERKEIWKRESRALDYQYIVLILTLLIPLVFLDLTIFSRLIFIQITEEYIVLINVIRISALILLFGGILTGNIYSVRFDLKKRKLISNVINQELKKTPELKRIYIFYQRVALVTHLYNSFQSCHKG